MRFKDVSFPDPQQNIAFDEELLRLADKERAGPALRFWESPRVFIVVGRIGKIEEDVKVKVAESDGVPILRRASGGGTVVQGPGCLNYTLVLSKQEHPVLNDLRRSYAWISQKVIDALKPLGVEAVFRSVSDIAVAGSEKKFSGNAQKRGKNYVLHHGTILYNFDLSLISRYLTIPKDVPAYRQGRSHTDFVTNIPIDPVAFKVNMCRAFDPFGLLP